MKNNSFYNYSPDMFIVVWICNNFIEKQKMPPPSPFSSKLSPEIGSSAYDVINTAKSKFRPPVPLVIKTYSQLFFEFLAASSFAAGDIIGKSPLGVAGSTLYFVSLCNDAAKQIFGERYPKETHEWAHLSLINAANVCFSIPGWQGAIAGDITSQGFLPALAIFGSMTYPPLASKVMCGGTQQAEKPKSWRASIYNQSQSYIGSKYIAAGAAIASASVAAVVIEALAVSVPVSNIIAGGSLMAAGVAIINKKDPKQVIKEIEKNKAVIVSFADAHKEEGAFFDKYIKFEKGAFRVNPKAPLITSGPSAKELADALTQYCSITWAYVYEKGQSKSMSSDERSSSLHIYTVPAPVLGNSSNSLFSL